MDRTRLVIAIAVAFVAGVIVGGALVYVYPDYVGRRAIKALQEENRLLREMNELREQELNEIKRVLERQPTD